MKKIIIIRISESSNYSIPRETIGMMDLAKKLTCVFDFTLSREGEKFEEFSSSKRVVYLACFDEVGMDLLEVSCSLASADLREE